MVMELFIENVKADLSEDIAADITFSLADIRTPDKRQVNYSKTVSLPGTEQNNFIFGYIYNIDISNPNDPAGRNVGINYNPKKLAKAKLFADGIQIFDGTLRLWKVVTKGSEVTYEVSLFGKLFDIFSTIGDSKLTDLDFSDLNHAYTWDNIKATWDDEYNGSFFYPLIDYGYNILNESGQPDNIKFGSLIACLKYMVIFDRIFQSISAEYTLGFSDTTVLDKIIVTPNEPFVKNLPQFLETEKNIESDYDADLLGHSYSHINFFNEVNIIVAALELEVGSDTGSTGNTINILDNIATSFQFNFNVNARHDIDSEASFNSIKFDIKLDRSGTVTTIGTYTLIPTTVNKNYNVVIEIPKASYLPDDFIYVDIELGPFNEVSILPGTKVYAISPADTSDYTLQDGDVYEMSRSVPVELKQVDFIKDFIKYFNLFVTQDPEDPTKYKFTPQIDFYIRSKLTAIEWTYKVNYDKEINYTPISQLTAREYLFTWKQDKDYWCEKYFTLNKEVYGQVTYAADTDVITTDQKIEMIFSPAVMVRYNESSVITPAIYRVVVDAGVEVRTPDKFNSRLLIWGGLQLAGHDIVLEEANGDANSVVIEYPYAGHLDNPIDPIFDLNFSDTNTDLPKSSINQFSKYWLSTLLDASHKDGKLVDCEMYLKPEDIEKLDFAALIKIGDHYFRINKISKFNPFELSTCKVELIKVINL